jgi:hypothetical protein
MSLVPSKEEIHVTLNIELPPDVEARYAAEARAKGVPLERHLRDLLIEGALSVEPSKESQIREDERERRLEELFDSFDSMNVAAEVSEEAFHRENWYR